MHGEKHGGHVSESANIGRASEQMVRSIVVCWPVDGGKHFARGVRVFRWFSDGLLISGGWSPVSRWSSGGRLEVGWRASSCSAGRGERPARSGLPGGPGGPGGRLGNRGRARRAGGWLSLS